MGPLTDRVISLALNDKFNEDATSKAIIEFLKADVNEGANIELLLTHLGDLISLSERTRTNSILLTGNSVSKIELQTVHIGLLEIIADTIRFGYRPRIEDNSGKETSAELVGSIEEPIVDIQHHLAFVSALYGSGRAGLENRRPAIELFTTNYDTLIEDALAIQGVSYFDGFIGGGVAYWAGMDASSIQRNQAIVTKLHGSIDWYRSPSSPTNLLRRRYGDSYPSEGGAVMIYPQATKYVHAQRNPFADLFQRFRNRLMDGKDQVLFVCGYSFGDDHINAEIDFAMSSSGSQLTLVIFAHESESGLPNVLKQWRNQREWRDRVFVASPYGLYQGPSDVAFPAKEGERNWWSFEGVSELFRDGIPSDIQELME